MMETVPQRLDPVGTAGGARQLLRDGPLRLTVVTGVLLGLLLLPVWCWPLVASQDGLSHLYNADVLNESLAGHGASLSVYEVAWRPVPNWAGTLLLIGFLKVLPLSLIPRVMLTLTSVAPILAMLALRRQVGQSRGLLWFAACAGCLATGRAWALGFESFCLGIAAVVGVIALYVRYRDELNVLKSLAIAGLLTVAFFCHLVPWAFAMVALAALSLIGPVQGRKRRLLATGAILLLATSWFVLYASLFATREGGVEFDWRHLRGFHLLGVRSWLMLLGRADCISLMNTVLPFTGIGFAHADAPGGPSANHGLYLALARLVLNPFVMVFAAAFLQACGTLVVDLRARDYRHLAWLVLGMGGVILALFMPDGTAHDGSILPLRVMLFSLTMLAIYVRFDVNRWLTVGTSILVALAFTLHLAEVWDYAGSAHRRLLLVREAAMSIPPGERIFQIGAEQDPRFKADALAHCGGYAALLSRGVWMSNYEAAHYYFPVQLRPSYPETLVSLVGELESLDLEREADRGRLKEFLADHERYIDVLLVRNTGPDIVALVRGRFAEVLWHRNDLWVLHRKQAATITGADNRDAVAVVKAEKEAKGRAPDFKNGQQFEGHQEGGPQGFDAGGRLNRRDCQTVL